MQEQLKEANRPHGYVANGLFRYRLPGQEDHLPRSIRKGDDLHPTRAQKQMPRCSDIRVPERDRLGQKVNYACSKSRLKPVSRSNKVRKASAPMLPTQREQFDWTATKKPNAKGGVTGHGLRPDNHWLTILVILTGFYQSSLETVKNHYIVE